ncbi:MAG: hypothetical protein LBI56_02605 [Puniceicoccales bacterium]|jgi:hypothetical protein|nr:hypothetical protein [Puniceicoccales bacterium]
MCNKITGSGCCETQYINSKYAQFNGDVCTNETNEQRSPLTSQKEKINKCVAYSTEIIAAAEKATKRIIEKAKGKAEIEDRARKEKQTNTKKEKIRKAEVIAEWVKEELLKSEGAQMAENINSYGSISVAVENDCNCIKWIVIRIGSYLGAHAGA